MTPKKVLTKEEKAERNRKRLLNYNPVSAARNAWRREFSRSPVVIELMRDPATRRYVPQYKKDGTRSKIDAVEHLCSKCKQWKRSAKKSKVAVDHIVPVVDPEVGFVDFNTYFKRMWCDRSNLWKICGDCHQKKTNSERLQRQLTEYRSMLDEMETTNDIPALKVALKKFDKKRLAICTQDIVDRVNKLKEKVSNGKPKRRTVKRCCVQTYQHPGNHRSGKSG